MINVENLTKTFGKKTALRDITFTIDEPQIIALVGNNGAGKTTLINILIGNEKPTCGTATIEGVPVYNNWQGMSKVMIIDEKVKYDPTLSLEKIIKKTSEFAMDFSGAKATRLLNDFHLPPKRLYSRLSKGMKNQFNICMGLASEKDYLLFDEPVSGLDENARDSFYRILNDDYCERPRYIVVSTHLLAELQNITSRLIVLKDGACIAYDDTDAIANMFATVSGETTAVAKLIADKKVYKQETFMTLTSCIVDKNFTRQEHKFIVDNNITLTGAKANEACKILCNAKEE